MGKLFRVGETLPKRTVLYIEIAGLLFIILVWYLLTIPLENKTLKFSSSSPSETKYVFEGPNGFNEEFSGDNFLEKLKPGDYKIIATDSTGAKINANVTIPDSIGDDDIVKEFSSRTGKLKLTVTIRSLYDGYVSKAVLPPPLEVLKSFDDLHYDKKEVDGEIVRTVKKNSVIFETGYSLWLNILGYVEAVLLSIIMGFLIGLIPFCRALLSRWVNAIRFVPLTAVTGLFIAWFGIDSNMKVQFLAFGIFVYLLPVVVQRIDEVQKTYLQTAYTLGASKWQQITSVYWPSVVSRIIDDIRVLTAISWTYIIIAEMLNQTGGIGALIHLSGRASQLDQVFALLLVIIVIGVLQDRLFVFLDKVMFKFKYQGQKK